MSAEDTSQNQKEKKQPCPECTINAGVAVALRICQLAAVNCDDIQARLFGGEITVQEALDGIKERLKGDLFNAELVEEVENMMKEQLDKQATCVSIVVKQSMTKQIDVWVQDREKAASEAPAESKFVEGTKELIQNLKKSKDAIEKIPTCEEAS